MPFSLGFLFFRDFLFVLIFFFCVMICDDQKYVRFIIFGAGLFFYEILNLKTLFLFFRSLRYWHFWHFFPVVKDKHPVKSLVIGRPILLAIEDVDGSPSFLEKALRFIEDHGGFPFPLCLLLPFLVHISGLLPFPISSMDSFILWLRDKTGNTWDSIVLVFFLLWYTRIWSFMLSVVN